MIFVNKQQVAATSTVRSVPVPVTVPVPDTTTTTPQQQVCNHIQANNIVLL